MKRILLLFLVLLIACTPPSGLTTLLLTVQVAIEAATPLIELRCPTCKPALSYVSAALEAVQTSASILSRGPVTQAGADEIAAAWKKAVLDPRVLQGAPPDVVAIITAISNAATAFVHQLTAGRAAVSGADRTQVTYTFSRSDRRALADIEKRAAKLRHP